MQYNLDIRDKAIFDSVIANDKYYQMRRQVESAYFVIECAVKSFFSLFSLRNLVLVSLFLMSLELLVISVLMVVNYA